MSTSKSEQNTFFEIIGPCSLESEQQIRQVAALADSLSIPFLRTPLFKPRTKPNSFQGLGADALPMLKRLKTDYPSLHFVAEVCSADHLDMAKSHIDIIQIGSRNMQNFELLKAIASKHHQNNKFFILKRGFSATLEEWVSAAEYLIQYGIEKEKLILCERGVRNHAATNHVVLDFATAIEARKLGFKVIVDPSHGSKQADLVLPLAKASLAFDLDGYMVEVHPSPKESVSDAKQAIGLEEFSNFYQNKNKWEIK